MRVLLRLLILVLVLASSGIPQSLACTEPDCCAPNSTEIQAPNHESHEETCSDDCGLCICCPLRAAPAAWASLPTQASSRKYFAVLTDDPNGILASREIFQPPRS
jgi:hypothetical protein